jgi:quercetin dioxygenase-like cupin family protein
MNAERTTELAALNAAGVLDGDDLREFQILLAESDSALARDLGRWNDVVAAVIIAGTEPRSVPAELKARVIERIAASAKPAPAKQTASFYSILQSEGEWKTLLIPGVRVKDLAADARRGMSLKLYELAPGTRFPTHHHSGPEECFVVSGDFHVEGRVLHGGDFHHAEGDSDHGESFTENGCTLLVTATTADYQ